MLRLLVLACLFSGCSKDSDSETPTSPTNPAPGTSVSYSWSFGDGTTGSGDTVTHAYASAGSYTAVVTATNSSGKVMPRNACQAVAPSTRAASYRSEEIDCSAPLVTSMKYG